MCLKNGALPVMVDNSSGSSSSSGINYKNIHVKEFKKDEDKYTIIDVRIPEDYHLGNIKNSKNIGISELLTKAKRGKIDFLKTKPIMIICNTGNLSSIASTNLAKLGYDNVHNLLGGMKAYNNENACSFDFLVMLGHGPEKIDQVTMAFSFAFGSVKENVSTAIVLVSDAVKLAKKGATENLWAGEPFKKIDFLMKKYLEKGGCIFACGGCLKNKKVKFEDCMKGIKKCNSQDVVRWNLNSKGNIQYI